MGWTPQSQRENALARWRAPDDPELIAARQARVRENIRGRAADLLGDVNSIAPFSEFTAEDRETARSVLRGLTRLAEPRH